MMSDPVRNKLIAECCDRVGEVYASHVSEQPSGGAVVDAGWPVKVHSAGKLLFEDNQLTISGWTFSVTNGDDSAAKRVHAVLRHIAELCGICMFVEFDEREFYYFPLQTPEAKEIDELRAKLEEAEAALRAQGEPVAWRVTGPYEDYATKAKEGAEAYCKGLNKGFGENAYTMSPLYAAPHPQGEEHGS
jgi:muconolactone delta-isomerase